MDEIDKNRILNFLIKKEDIRDFESWVYTTSDLESRVGSELYLELISINYNDKFVRDNLSKVILGNHITKEDFESFKYYKFLENSGWYQNRNIELDRANFPNTPEFKNAVKILNEFGGLKFVSPERRENWTLTIVEFFEAPAGIQNMKEYGLNKNLVCFASVHNSHAYLFVDENNKFYQLDIVVSENLYKFKGLDFKHMMRQLLQLENNDNFEIVGNNDKNNN